MASILKFVSHLQLTSLLHFYCLILCLLISITKFDTANAVRAKRSSFLNELSIHTEPVDPRNRTILAMFNLTQAQMNRIYEVNNAKKDPVNQKTDTNLDAVKEYRLKDIRQRLEAAFGVGSKSDESQEHPYHEMAAYPICNTEIIQSTWLLDNNITIRFSDTLFEPKSDNLNLDSAILRLYKINPNNSTISNNNNNNTSTTTQQGSSSSTGDASNANINSSDEEDVNHNIPKRCAKRSIQIDPQIRVTVSIVHQMRRNKRERKKRICNTIMMNVSKTGWVEIDIKRAIHIWEDHGRQSQQQQRQQPVLVGWLMIEVHDEEERPLKPGLFFQPPKCEQADLAIPWNYYGPQSALSSYSANDVPKYPRLDVKLIGYASFASKADINRPLPDKLRDTIRRQLYNVDKVEHNTSKNNNNNNNSNNNSNSHNNSNNNNNNNNNNNCSSNSNNNNEYSDLIDLTTVQSTITQNINNLIETTASFESEDQSEQKQSLYSECNEQRDHDELSHHRHHSHQNNNNDNKRHNRHHHRHHHHHHHHHHNHHDNDHHPRSLEQKEQQQQQQNRHNDNRESESNEQEILSKSQENENHHRHRRHHYEVKQE